MCVILCTCAYLVLECHKVNIVMCYKRQGVTLTLSKHCPVKLTKEMTRLLPTVYSPPTPLMTLSVWRRWMRCSDTRGDAITMAKQPATETPSGFKCAYCRYRQPPTPVYKKLILHDCLIETDTV